MSSLSSSVGTKIIIIPLIIYLSVDVSNHAVIPYNSGGKLIVPL